MKKIITYISIFMIIVSMSIVTTNAQSVNEKQAEIDAINAEKDAKVQALQQTERTIEETNSQIAEVEATQAQLEAEVEATTAQIDNLNEEIANTEYLIPIYTEKSNAILRVLQKNSHNSYLLEEIFSDSLSPGESIRKVQVATKLTEASVDIVNQTISLENELAMQKQTLIDQEANLAVQDAQLASQEEYLAVLLEETEVEKMEIESDVLTHESEIIAEQSLLALMEEAGCTGNQIYGVDCGVAPSVPAYPETGGDIDTGGEDTGSEETTDNGGGGESTGPSGFIRPTSSGQISDEFGPRAPSECGNGIPCDHSGIDIANSCGTPIYAPAPGVVTAAFYDSLGGNTVYIVHNVNGQPITTTYSHLSSLGYVYPGMQVDYDTQIGNIGLTGSATTGCHLHLGAGYGTTGSTNSRFDPRNIFYFPPLGSWFYSRY